jgi:hypothetical protein
MRQLTLPARRVCVAEVDNGRHASVGLARIGGVVDAERCLLGLHRVGRVDPWARPCRRNGPAATCATAERLSQLDLAVQFGAAESGARFGVGEGGKLHMGYDELVEQAFLCLARARATETPSLVDALTRAAIQYQREAAAVVTPKGCDVVILHSGWRTRSGPTENL